MIVKMGQEAVGGVEGKLKRSTRKFLEVIRIFHIFMGGGDGSIHVHKCQILTEIYIENQSDISLYVNYSKYISVRLTYLKNEHSALVIYSSDIKKATLTYLESL